MKKIVFLSVLSSMSTIFSGEKLQIANASERALRVTYVHEKCAEFTGTKLFNFYVIESGETRRMPGTRRNPTEIGLEKKGTYDSYPEKIKIGDCKKIVIAESEQGKMSFYREERLIKLGEIKL